MKQFVATFLVQHAAGRTITSVDRRQLQRHRRTPERRNAGVTGQTTSPPPGGDRDVTVSPSASTSASPAGSAVTSSAAPPEGRRPRAMPVVDSTGEQSATCHHDGQVHRGLELPGRADFPRLTGVCQTDTEVAPGQDITYTFTCDDVDSPASVTTTMRPRRLPLAAARRRRHITRPRSKTGIDDNTARCRPWHSPAQGYYVVEAQLGNENGSCPDPRRRAAGWWRLGNAVVNDAAARSPARSPSPAPSPSIPPSVNQGGTVNGDGDCRRQQAARCRSSSGTPTATAPSSAASTRCRQLRRQRRPSRPLTTGELSAGRRPSTPGLKTVQARHHRQRRPGRRRHDPAPAHASSGQLRVNALPTASNVSHTVNEDSAATITLVGNDPDTQPAPLVYTIVSGLQPEPGTLGPVVRQRRSPSRRHPTPTARPPSPTACGTATGRTVGANGFSTPRPSHQRDPGERLPRSIRSRVTTTRTRR